MERATIRMQYGRSVYSRIKMMVDELVTLGGTLTIKGEEYRIVDYDRLEGGHPVITVRKDLHVITMYTHDPKKPGWERWKSGELDYDSDYREGLPYWIEGSVVSALYESYLEVGIDPLIEQSPRGGTSIFEVENEKYMVTLVNNEPTSTYYILDDERVLLILDDHTETYSLDMIASMERSLDKKLILSKIVGRVSNEEQST